VSFDATVLSTINIELQTKQLKGRSPVCINMFTLENDKLSAAQFVTIKCRRDFERPQTTHASS